MDCCRTLPDSICLLPAGERTETSCCVCARILEWSQSGFAAVMVREIRHGQGCYVFPSHLAGDGDDALGCVLCMSFATHSHREIRSTVNHLLMLTDEVWIYDPRDAAERLR